MYRPPMFRLKSILVILVAGSGIHARGGSSLRSCPHADVGSANDQRGRGAEGGYGVITEAGVMCACRDSGVVGGGWIWTEEVGLVDNLDDCDVDVDELARVTFTRNGRVLSWS